VGVGVGVGVDIYTVITIYGFKYFTRDRMVDVYRNTENVKGVSNNAYVKFLENWCISNF